jgi:TRAP-type C4-dicarboxylate transport system permease small subunit
VIAGRLCRAHDAVTDAGFFLARLCLVGIVAAYTYETVARYFFAAPTSWSNEVVSYALCIGTFLAMPELTRRGGHITISFALEMAPARIVRVALPALAVASGAVCLFVAWLSLQENIRQVVNEVMLVRVQPVPKVWISSWITYGFLSSALYFFRAAGRNGEAPDPQGAPVG